jgi:DNA (cytosine-5)-methyltransferase 1
MTRGSPTDQCLHPSCCAVTDLLGNHMVERPVAIDLFAGAGGLSLGLEQAGFDVAVAVELDPVHAATHTYNFPQSTVFCADIQDIQGEELLASVGLEVGEVDVVAGGPPCQGFSLIGKRMLDDPRNSLVMEYLRIVREIQPRAFVFENVPGLTVGDHRTFLDELVAEFRKLGYRMPTEWQVLDAAAFGTPQHRRRLFLVGTRADQDEIRYPVPTFRPADLRNVKFEMSDLPVGPTVSDAIADLPEIDSFKELFSQDWLNIELQEPSSSYAAEMRGIQRRASDFSYPRLVGAHRLTGLKRAAHTDLSRRRFADTEPGKTEPVSRFKKLALDGLCNTLRAGTARNRGAFTSPRPIHPVSPRCISVREAARLHSFPDWFSFHATIWHGFRQIGNSVPALLGEAVSRQVASALGYAPVRPTITVELRDEWLRHVSMGAAAEFFDVPTDVIPHRIRGATAEAASAG